MLERITLIFTFIWLAVFSHSAFADNRHHHPAPPNSVEQFYMDTFGVSARIARHRNKMMDQASEIAEMLEIKNDSFAGMAIQHSPFKIKIMVKRQKRCKKKNYYHHNHKHCKKNLTASLIKRLVKGTKLKKHIKIIKVNNSNADLEDIQAQINSIAKDYNNGIFSTAIDTNLNTIAIIVDSPEQFQQYLDDNNLILPKGIIIEQGAGELNALSYGGEFIGNTGGSVCTAGFVVTNATGARGLVTAAHCDNNLNWQGNQGLLTFQQQLFPQDIQWHLLPPNLSTASSNRILVSENPNVFQTITALAVPSAGIPVCLSGVITGQSCGIVVRTGFTTNYRDENNIARQGFNMVQVSRNGQVNGGGIAVAGDSGGPVYRGSTAVGLVHAGDGQNIYISPINSVYALGLRLLTR